MNLRTWLQARSPSYLRERGTHIWERYTLGARQMVQDICRCASETIDLGGAFTFFVPGSVMERHVSFIQDLAGRGVEIGVHSYSHIDLSRCPVDAAVEQLMHAAKICRNQGLPVRGFRCPYLSCTDVLLAALPANLFDYSSNRALYWETPASRDNSEGQIVFETLAKFYHPGTALTTLCLPSIVQDLIEIPVIVPDDLQVVDGLHRDIAGLGKYWQEILRGTHARGDLFSLLFHLEMAAQAEEELGKLVQEAKQMYPPVWMAQLCQISDWWREKAAFRSEFVNGGSIPRLALHCSPRATVLSRGLGSPASEGRWDENYVCLEQRVLDLSPETLPFVGLMDGAEDKAQRLREYGYIVETGELAGRCAVRITEADGPGYKNEVELIRLIEEAPGPLIKFGTWPYASKSALCLGGDLDALSLLDYTARLVGR